MNTEQLLAHIGRVLNVGPADRGARLLPMPGSTSGKVFAVELAGRRWVLRQDRSIGAASRLAREFQVLQALQDAGVAPAPVWLDAGLGLLLCEFVQGAPWSEQMIASPQQLDRLARVLAGVHQHHLEAPAMEPLSMLESYLQGAETPLAESLREHCGLAMAQMSCRQQALCHHDLWRGNILQARRIRLIDWEYAACGDPLFDLATVISYHDLAPPQADALWSAYREYSGMHRQYADLDRWCVVVDTLTLAWALARADDPMASASAGPFAARAARRLGLEWPASKP